VAQCVAACCCWHASHADRTSHCRPCISRLQGCRDHTLTVGPNCTTKEPRGESMPDCLDSTKLSTAYCRSQTSRKVGTYFSILRSRDHGRASRTKGDILTVPDNILEPTPVLYKIEGIQASCPRSPTSKQINKKLRPTA
jgi:hypothetical protein